MFKIQAMKNPNESGWETCREIYQKPGVEVVLGETYTKKENKQTNKNQLSQQSSTKYEQKAS